MQSCGFECSDVGLVYVLVSLWICVFQCSDVELVYVLVLLWICVYFLFGCLFWCRCG